MEFIFEILLQFLGEILLQMFFEILVEVGFHGFRETFKKPSNRVLSAFGFALWGALAGGLSLLIFPHSPISSITLRRINLVVTPLIAGGIMTLIGRVRDRKGLDLVRLDRFGYAFIFALSMAIVRFAWAK